MHQVIILFPITLQFLLICISRVFHSTQTIVKPQAKSNEAAQKEIEEAMGRVKETQNLISATIDPGKSRHPFISIFFVLAQEIDFSPAFSFNTTLH
jgi:hypothetical protein